MPRSPKRWWRTIYIDEISIEDARLSDSGVAVGDQMDCRVMVSEFEPKTIKIAKKLIQDRIKELENDRVIFDFAKFIRWLRAKFLETKKFKRLYENWLSAVC